jgi:N-acetyl sugar amidotransferase
MDTTDPDIRFDDTGVCSNCHRYEIVAQRRLVEPRDKPLRLRTMLERIHENGRNKEYDCVIGVSGGVDSTYVAYLTRQWGLRPLAVHFDNGWNSELAVANIEKALKLLKIDLSTFVVDWEEFRDLQLSFLKASTPDGEIPTDHAILALLYRTAAHFGLKYILLGTNLATESVLPLKWGYGYFDFKYIGSVQRRFGKLKLRTYPRLTLPQLFNYTVIRGIRMISVLDYVDYRKDKAIETLKEQLGWTYYGGKHYESIYTRFFQAYILPRKFQIDKRRAHYSSLLHSGEFSRADAMTCLEEPVYPEDKLREDREYVIKKLRISETEFDAIMRAPTRTFCDYPTHHALLERIKRLRSVMSF